MEKFPHNSVRDILGHAARVADFSAVVIEKMSQAEVCSFKPGDITAQHYHRGFASSALDITVSHPLQKKYLSSGQEVAEVSRSVSARGHLLCGVRLGVDGRCH